MEDRYVLSFAATISPFHPSIRSFQENIMGSIKIDFVGHTSYIRPEVVIPCHYDTFPNQRADIETMQMLAEHMCPNTAIAKVLPGQSLAYHSSRVR